jgi:predicted RNA-binding Zn ribbon-like protein
MGEDNESRHNCCMHWIEKDGVPLPRRLGGHPALDLCNTWAGWGERTDVDDAKREWLPTYDVLAVWSGYADVLARAHALRSAVHDAVLDPRNDRALVDLTVEVRRAGARVEPVPTAGTVGWRVPVDVGLELPVLAAAWSAADLLASADVEKVAACPGVDCGWLFLDRRGRRRWCDMAACGNRAKQAAHAQRARAALS